MVRSVLVLRAAPGRRDEVVALFERLRVLELASEVPGFCHAELARGVDDADELLVTAAWESPEAYARWLESPMRELVGRELEPLLAAEPAPRVYELARRVP